MQDTAKETCRIQGAPVQHVIAKHAGPSHAEQPPANQNRHSAPVLMFIKGEQSTVLLAWATL